MRRIDTLIVSVGRCCRSQGGAGAAILAFARYRSEPEWWVFLGVGLLLTISGAAMLRIGQGINKNGEVLRKVAAVIGDKDIPSVGKWYKSVAFWISWTMVVLGAGCLLTAFSTLTTTNGRCYLPIHKVFISYYHCEDQDYKDELVEMGEENRIFIDRSVDTDDISDQLPPKQSDRKSAMNICVTQRSPLYSWAKTRGGESMWIGKSIPA